MHEYRHKEPQRIPDPTTAGDFCRRFSWLDVELLMGVFNETRLKIWKQQGTEFLAEAFIDADGTMVETTGECKEGIDINHNPESYGQGSPVPGEYAWQTAPITKTRSREVLRSVRKRIIESTPNRPMPATREWLIASTRIDEQMLASTSVWLKPRE